MKAADMSVLSEERLDAELEIGYSDIKTGKKCLYRYSKRAVKQNMFYCSFCIPKYAKRKDLPYRAYLFRINNVFIDKKEVAMYII